MGRKFKFKLPATWFALSFMAVTGLCLPQSVTGDQVSLVKKNFTITFPDGWVVLPDPDMAKNDSGFWLADTLSNEGYALGQVQETSVGLSAKEIIAHFSYPLLSGKAVTDSLDKVLGQHKYTVVGYRDSLAKGDTATRFRLYKANIDRFVFVTWLSYFSDTGEDFITRLETALATFDLTTANTLIKVRRSPNSKVVAYPFDILGRDRKNLWKGTRFPGNFPRQ